MPTLLRCPNGHAWPASPESHAPPAAGTICPVCGIALPGRLPDNPATIAADGVAPAAVGAVPCQAETLPLMPSVEVEATLPPSARPVCPPPPVDGQATVPLAEAGLPRGPDTPAVPGYEILRPLGRGGMGIVYQARQLKLNRIVALKMILSGKYAGEEDLERFRTEGEAVARIQHPNVVQIHEVGEQDGLPFFSLEFCPGGTLEKKLSGKPLPPPEAAALVEALARGVDAAHRKGVIHRDLKPANVLLAEDGTPKITDFGLAKKLDEQGLTATGAVMGTPSYMAPEQAGGKSKDIGPACDVYALGAILYQCLTGRPPFLAATAMDTLLQVVSEEPVSVKRLNGQVPLDLETICLKCLQKEQGQRYPDAASLADDLRRFRAGEAIRARPVGRLERGWRWCRRNPAVAALTAAVSLLVVAVAVVASVGYAQTTVALRSEERQRAAALDAQKVAEEQREEARLRQKEAEEQHAAARAAEDRATSGAAFTRRLLYAANMQLAAQGWESPAGKAQAVAALLAGEVPAPGGPDLREFAWRHQWWLLYRAGVVLPDHGGAVAQGAFDGDGTLLTIDEKNHLRRWDVAERKATLDVDLAAEGTPAAVALAPGGQRLAVASAEGAVRLLDAKSGQPLRTLAMPLPGVKDVLFLDEGRKLLTRLDDGVVHVWDAETGQLRETVKGAGSRLETKFALSPDGERAINRSGSAGAFVQMVSWRNGKAGAPMNHNLTITAAGWSPDGKTLALGDIRGHVLLREAATGKPSLERISGHVGPVKQLAFSGDGTLLASGGADGVVAVWQADSGELVRRFKGHTGAITFLCFSPDGQTLASGGEDHTARLWGWGGTRRDQWDQKANVFGLAYSPDGRRLACTAGRRLVNLWDLESGHIARALSSAKQLTHQMQCLAYSADGALLAAEGPDAEVVLWDPATVARLRTLPAPPRELDEGPGRGVAVLAFSPDGKYLAAGFGLVTVPATRPGQHPRAVRVWDPHTGKEVRTLEGHGNAVTGLAFSPDGSWLATASRDRMVRLWRVANWQEERHWSAEVAQATVAFSHDGRLLIAGGSDGIVRAWDPATGQQLASFPAHGQRVTGLAFSPDDRTVASVGMDHQVKLWDPVTWRELRTLGEHDTVAWSVAFAPDGNSLASGGGDNMVRFWRAAAPADVGSWSATPTSVGKHKKP